MDFNFVMKEDKATHSEWEELCLFSSHVFSLLKRSYFKIHTRVVLVIFFTILHHISPYLIPKECKTIYKCETIQQLGALVKITIIYQMCSYQL